MMEIEIKTMVHSSAMFNEANDEADIQYFMRKLHRVLKVPKEYLL